MIAFGSSLAYQFSPDTVDGLNVLLFDRFNRYKAHARPTHRFTDRFSVVGVVLVALDVRFGKLWRNQLDGIATGLQLASPVVGTTTGFHADFTARFNSLQQCLQPVSTAQLFASNGLLSAINTVYLEHILCQVDPNANKLHGGLLLLRLVCGNSSVAPRCPFGEEESIPLLSVCTGHDVLGFEV